MSKLELSNNIPNYLSDEYILVNASLFASEASPDLIREYVCEISDFLMANNKSKVGLNIISEGLAFNSIGTSNKIIKEFLEQHNKMPSSFTFIFGASPCTKNINYYKAYCKRFNWFEIPIIFVNWWEYYFSGKINEENSIYSTITTTPSIKSKKFLCYNRNPKPHRLYITTECIKRDLIKDAYISNYFKFPEDEFNFGSTYEWFPTLYQEMHDLMYEHKDKFPLDLGLASIPKDKQTDKFMAVSNDDVNYFQDSYFGVITESKYAHDNYDIYNQIHSQLSLDGFMFTEKTYKFISAKKPFILVGFTGSLQMLRDFGYRTFHPYINETYDTIVDDEQRITMIVNEIERLCKMSDSKWLEWQHNVEPIILHNYNTLKNAGELILSYHPKPQ
jgi:hypothetical protein